MSSFVVDNSGEVNYQQKVTAIANALSDWQGSFVLVAHVDPDGDALGSSLALKRALDAMGKRTLLPLDAPRYLAFLANEGELSDPIDALPDDCLLVVLDVSDRKRAAGAPTEGAAFIVNIDHHGTNDRFGDLALVEPASAATAQIVKDIIDALPVSWTPEIATPCLTGVLTDTGNFRYANTSPDVLACAGELLEKGVDYAGLTDRLQWRHPDYFKMLGLVMSSVEFAFDGLLVSATITQAMRDEIGDTDDDSNDYVGLIRYAEGTKIAALLKEHDGFTKLSVRTRDDVSAQAICMQLGGGGHVVAAGAKLAVGLEEAKALFIEAARAELVKKNLL